MTHATSRIYEKVYVPKWFLMEGYQMWESWKGTAAHDGLLIRSQLMTVEGQLLNLMTAAYRAKTL